MGSLPSVVSGPTNFSINHKSVMRLVRSLKPFDEVSQPSKASPESRASSPVEVTHLIADQTEARSASALATEDGLMAQVSRALSYALIKIIND